MNARTDALNELVTCHLTPWIFWWYTQNMRVMPKAYYKYRDGLPRPLRWALDLGVLASIWFAFQVFVVILSGFIALASPSR